MYVSDVTQEPDEGEVLPERSADDSDTGWGEVRAPDPDEEARHYAEDRPPHWEP